jgi:hypothetical protein
MRVLLVVFMQTINTYYVKENRGYDNWDKVCKTNAFDVFSTTILNYSLPRSYFKSITQRTIDAARKTWEVGSTMAYGLLQ